MRRCEGRKEVWGLARPAEGAGLGALGLLAAPVAAHPDHHQPTQQGQGHAHQSQQGSDHDHDH